MRPLLLVVLSVSLRASAQDPLPEAPGKATFEKLCSTCHDTGQVVARRRTHAAWAQVVDDMVGRGADGSKEDLAAVVAYLAASFGRTNVNSATAADIEKNVGLSSKDAQAIVAYRDKNGKIADFDTLLKIPGIDAAKLREKRGWIAFAD